MDSGTVCEALSGKSPVKSESLAHGGVMSDDDDPVWQP
jgi:hypothetical protein